MIFTFCRLAMNGVVCLSERVVCRQKVTLTAPIKLKEATIQLTHSQKHTCHGKEKINKTYSI